jgi:hypothetical protein
MRREAVDDVMTSRAVVSGKRELRDRWVHFRIRDVYLPAPSELALTLHGDDLLQGRVIDVSEGAARDDYVVVKVEGLAEPIVLPQEWILGVLR